MGDFDRNQEAATPASQGRQVTVAAVLVIVLLSVLGYHYFSGGPKTASAALGEDGLSSRAVEPAQTPEQALAALSNDPTANLMRGSFGRDHSMDAPPRNAFAMTDGWRATLVRAIPVEQAPVQPAPTAPQPAAQALRVEDFRLGSIFRQGDHFSAVINGKFVRAGMVVGGAKVVEIRDDRVILQNHEAPAAPVTELLLEPRLK